jgi:hypothetical protein
MKNQIQSCVLVLAVVIGACGGRTTGDATADSSLRSAVASARPVSTDEQALARCSTPPDQRPPLAIDNGDQLAVLLEGRWLLCHTNDEYSAPELFFGAEGRIGMEIGARFRWLTSGATEHATTTTGLEWAVTDRMRFTVGAPGEERRQFWIIIAPTNDRALLGSPELGSRTYDFVRVW